MADKIKELMKGGRPNCPVCSAPMDLAGHVCPRSNGHTGAGAPPLEDFYNYGVQVAVGTDSLASAPDLNVFADTVRATR